MQRWITSLIAPVLAGLALGACAQTAAEHQQHHPAGQPPAATARSTPEHTMQGMDRQMKAMQDMHARMAAAKTPVERNALMGEHSKLMQDGMAMMRGTGGMQGMGGMGSGGSAPDMAPRMQMMEKRMAMMQSMMQMMMDRLPAPAPDNK